ncbi:peptide chain release factor H [Sphingobacterium sp. G1-14]|uniref:peptide chain release factor H n=1 Tax=Sphingobacterium TaxID=28453 RepID=UPI000B4934B4|nr:peptide chain release factor H [Sphingobacterium sp. G1-14]
MNERYLQISSGRGPKECNMAVRLVVDRISSECSRVGVEVTEIETEEVDGLPCSLIVRLRGKDMDQLIDHWIGTICWVCKSPFRPLHKRKNWFVEVKTYHPGEKGKVLDVKDVSFQTMRSSGAGGQHVNKVSSGVRATHAPTGISVQVMDTRSQLQNKEIAMLRLAAHLRNLESVELNTAKEQKWKNQIEVTRGQAKRVFVGRNFVEK